MAAAAKPEIGFLGLGAMGFGMATHLVKRGYRVTAYDVFPEPLERFKALGGETASSLANSTQDKMYYVVMVATAAQAQEVLFGEKDGIVQTLPKGSVLALCSTVPSSYWAEVGRAVEEKGRGDLLLLDAPVSGGAGRAADGTLSVMVGGSEDAISKGRWLLEEMSDVENEKLYVVPGGLGKGSEMKMVHQVLAGVNILAVSEVMGLAARLELDLHKVRDAVLASESWSWLFENRIGRMLTEDFYPGASALTIILKDVGIITSQARLLGLPTPMSSTAENTYLTGLRLGYGAHDDAGMVRVYFAEPLSKANPTAAGSTEPRSTDLILKLLKAIHLAGVAEAVALTASLGLNFVQYTKLVSTAAGGSNAFQREAERMYHFLREGKGGLSAGGGSVDDILQDFDEIMQAAAQVKCSLFLGSEAMNLFRFAKTKGFGSAGVESLVTSWRRDSG